MESKNKTLLVVDDDIDFLFQLQFQLEKEGYNIISADSQKEAEKIISKIKPDLAIFDLMMESEDSGFILSYKFKKAYPTVPVIIITSVTTELGMKFGINSEEDKKWIKADAYIEKGISMDELLIQIQIMLSH